ncbi:hypothetical protein OOZ19_24830 [Saccharopolyspora sp. NFXS83]|uniref:hypothetical protein n=1 Tax=Saccharopolyspora sp. NFXS83 TaxID=2993560 RepID=UPI00224B50A5|nr:hypothetical protein [Saccharopolyspora sp. NFXS83]MCX2733481.1 hypothetical protein [Saccharopolyspora sp. NFXS83]
MIGRLLLIELRRSGALWFAAGFLLPTVVLLNMSGPWAHGGAQWDEQWTALVLWQRHQLSFTWPVVVGLGAWLGCARRRARLDEVLAGIPRPAWHRMALLVAPVAGCLVVAMLVPLAFGAVRVARYTSWYSTGWVAPLLIGALALVAGAVAGMGLGHALPVPITPAMATLAAFAVTVVLQPGPQTFTPEGGLPIAVELLSPVLRGPNSPYTTVALEVHIGQLLLFGGLGAGGFLLLVLRRARWTAVLPVLLGIALALAIFPDRASDAYPIDPACTGSTCVETFRDSPARPLE